MIFRKDIDYKKFFDSVNKCEKDVWLLTERGDELNLKSLLCQYVFIATRGDLKISGIVYCDKASDYAYIEKYLEHKCYT